MNVSLYMPKILSCARAYLGRDRYLFSSHYGSIWRYVSGKEFWTWIARAQKAAQRRGIARQPGGGLELGEIAAPFSRPALNLI